MTPDPIRTPPLESWPELIRAVPELVREVAELRAEVAAIREGRMKCPSCGCGAFRTIKTLPTPNGIKRRRECRGCKQRVTTYEVIGGA